MSLISHVKPRDLLCGIIILGFGILTIYLSHGYRMGTLTRMGPGFFPTALGYLLSFLGLAVMFIERLEGAVPKLPLRQLAAISAGILAFAALIESLGLAAAVAASVLLSSLAIQESRWGVSLASALLMALACISIFDWGLGLQLHAFG